MTSKSALSRRIVLEPFQFFIYVACGPEELLYYLGEKDIAINLGDKSIEDLAGFMNPLSGEDVDALLYFADDNLDHETIGHECLHLVHHILEDRGVPISNQNTEIMAYMQEHVIYEVKKALVHRGHLPKGSAKRAGRTTV